MGGAHVKARTQDHMRKAKGHGVGGETFKPKTKHVKTQR